MTRTGAQQPRSTAELLLSVQLEQAGIPFEREYEFAPEEWCRANGFLSPKRQLPRKWRADFRIAGNEIWYPGVIARFSKFLIEVDGGAFVAGRHSRGTGVERDAEKQSAAAILGYRVLRVTPAQVNDGRALSWIRQALGIEVTS